MTVEVTDLTEGSVGGSGLFDVLMKTVKAHLDEEFKAGRIKGTDYSTVYLGALTTIMEQSSSFLLAREKANLEQELLTQQVLLAQAQVAKTEAEIELAQQQVLNAQAELAIIQANASKVTAEVALLGSQKLKVEQDTANGVLEGENLVKQGCLLDAQYDVTMESKIKVAAESSLLAQKLISERAQTTSSGVDADSVVGRQKALYLAQANGFKRDAEQKAAQILIDPWKSRRLTNETDVQANADNKLGDTYIGIAVQKLLDGLNAT